VFIFDVGAALLAVGASGCDSARAAASKSKRDNGRKAANGLRTGTIRRRIIKPGRGRSRRRHGMAACRKSGDLIRRYYFCFFFWGRTLLGLFSRDCIRPEIRSNETLETIKNLKIDQRSTVNVNTVAMSPGTRPVP
jgi:hypothetical protein